MNLQEATKIVSQGVGFKLGNQLLDDTSIDKDVILKTITEVFAGDAVAPDEEIFKEAAQIVQEEVTIKLRAVGAGFLDVNKDKKGIVVTESGLQYRILKDGEGDAPKESDQVTVHYTGKLVDGSIFDSSIARGEPAQFAVNQVIPGWIEGLQLMKPGSKFEFFIPQELAYGEQGSEGAIPPYAALIFEVEMIKVG